MCCRISSQIGTLTSFGVVVLVLGCMANLISGFSTGSTQGHGQGQGIGFQKRQLTFMDIDCKGTYDKAIFSQMDRVCDDCYALYREPQLHYLCRSNCFGSPFFKGCLDALLWSDDAGKYEQMVEILGKKK